MASPICRTDPLNLPKPHDSGRQPPPPPPQWDLYSTVHEDKPAPPSAGRDESVAVVNRRRAGRERVRMMQVLGRSRKFTAHEIGRGADPLWSQESFQFVTM